MKKIHSGKKIKLKINKIFHKLIVKYLLVKKTSYICDIVFEEMFFVLSHEV